MCGTIQVQNVVPLKFVPQHKIRFSALEIFLFHKAPTLKGADDFVPELLFEGKQDMPSRAVNLCGMLGMMFFFLSEAATPHHGTWKKIQSPTSY